MAWSYASIGATDIALSAADKALLLGQNWARTANDVRWNTVGTIATADSPATGFETSFCYDDWDHLPTKPSGTGATWYLVFDLGSTDPGEIDTIAILNHNLGTISAAVTVEVGDTDFSAAVVQLVSGHSPADDHRIVYDDLRHTGSVALRYSSVRYIRFKFTGTAIQPQIGEVIIGRRRQLKINPLVPHDPNALQSAVTRVVTRSGVISDIVWHKGRKTLNEAIVAHEDTKIDELESFFGADTEYMTRPWLWIAAPGTSPNSAHWMKFDSAAQSGPLSGFTRRTFRLAGIEQGPNFLSAGE